MSATETVPELAPPATKRVRHLWAGRGREPLPGDLCLCGLDRWPDSRRWRCRPPIDADHCVVCLERGRALGLPV